LKSEEFSYRDDGATTRAAGEEWFGPEHAHYVFTGFLHCNICSETVVVTGDGVWEEEYGETEIEVLRWLRPRFFCPSLKIIEPNVSSDVPDDVFKYLEKAFQVFWCDADSCVNRLRTVVEYLLDGLGIARTTDKGVRLNLGPRIDMLTDPKYASIKDALTSLRYMGNDGSHGSVGIERHELLSAFAVVNYCLEQLYPKVTDHTDVLKFVSEVNARRGFRPKNGEG
jgi:hypothetical protein